MTKLLPRDA